MKTAFLSLITLALSSLASAVPASGSTAQSSSSSKHTVSPSGKASPASPTPSSAAAKSNPTPAGSAIPCKNVGDHGDGLYSGIKHDNGTSMYQFHGKGKPVAAASAAPASSKATKAAPTIDRRLNPDEKVNCLTGGNVPLADLDAARSGLVAQLGNGEYKIAKNNNLFFASGAAVVFACCYAGGGCEPTGDQFNNDMGAVSDVCGPPTSLGYVRDPLAAYGRTYYTDHWC